MEPQKSEKTALRDTFITMPAEEMTQISFDCDCGKTHAISIGELLIGRGVSAQTARLAAPFMGGKILLVADVHTYEVLGRAVEAQLKAAGARQRSHIFPDHHLVPNAHTLGTLLIEASEEPLSLLVAVGSGTLNDVTRYVSHRLRLPYLIIATAPSMDGYAGDSSPIVCRNNKETFQTQYAHAIVADTGILAAAPNIMLCAGFGDIIGKYIALADWRLARRVTGEYYCQRISDLMQNAVDKCVASVEGVVARDPAAMGSLVEALCLAGMAMGLSGVTRPASGSEHHMTHCFDIMKIAAGQDYPLHGNTVGVCTVVMARFYELAAQDGHIDITVPSPQWIRGLLERLGAPVHPKELGISREEFYTCMMTAKDLRPRYSMLKYAHEKGFLRPYVERITAEYYD